MADSGSPYDLLIIGGGINGAGIARDAAGRGLKVLLAEKGDLAEATSSASSKLIHGGLRYLEQYEFRLVAEALREREVLLQIAPHLIAPLTFVMPHVPELRPRWMIRVGLFLYDHLGRRTRLPGSHGVDLRDSPYRSGLKPDLRFAFVYSDCRVDDARLVLANAVSARELGAEIATRSECVWARRVGRAWHARLRTARGDEREVHAHGIVNASGPWVNEVLEARLDEPSREKVTLAKGSHIVVARAYSGEHALILQNDDGRVVFMIPFEEKYTLIGTTDIAFAGDPASASASAAEVDYLCRAVNRYLARPIAPVEVVWQYAGVRPLHDDRNANLSAMTRDYALRLDAPGGAAPALSVYGGKLTTYRALAERVLEKLAPWFPGMRPAWTAETPLPGGDLDCAPDAFRERLASEFAALPVSIMGALARRHGSRARIVLQGVRTLADLGTHFGADLYAREVDFMLEQEWATCGEDILYRRTKAGVHLATAQRAAASAYVAQRIAAR